MRPLPGRIGLPGSFAVGFSPVGQVEREERKTKAPPSPRRQDHSRILKRRTARPPHAFHRRFCSGSGKSTLLLNMIVQDIENGEGVAVLDPHGDLIDQVVGRIPEVAEQYGTLRHEMASCGKVEKRRFSGWRNV
jgi:primosomal protein N'